MYLPAMFGSAKVVRLGTELEFSTGYYSSFLREVPWDVPVPAEVFPRVVAHDGSVGREWRSRPATLETWQQVQASLDAAFTYLRGSASWQARADDEPRAGGHIHCDETTDRLAWHRIRGLVCKYHEVFRALSGRYTTRFCVFRRDGSRADRGNDKYRAVHAHYLGTVELRFWQSTLDVRTLLGQLEWSAALQRWAAVQAVTHPRRSQLRLTPLVEWVQSDPQLSHAAALWQRRVEDRQCPLPVSGPLPSHKKVVVAGAR